MFIYIQSQLMSYKCSSCWRFLLVFPNSYAFFFCHGQSYLRSLVRPDDITKSRRFALRQAIDCLHSKTNFKSSHLLHLKDFGIIISLKCIHSLYNIHQWILKTLKNEKQRVCDLSDLLSTSQIKKRNIWSKVFPLNVGTFQLSLVWLTAIDITFNIQKTHFCFY